LEARARIELANKGFAERFLEVVQGVVEWCRVAKSITYAIVFQPTTPRNRQNCPQNRLHPDVMSLDLNTLMQWSTWFLLTSVLMIVRQSTIDCSTNLCDATLKEAKKEREGSICRYWKMQVGAPLLQKSAATFVNSFDSPAML
jgi:hypothetical protein